MKRSSDKYVSSEYMEQCGFITWWKYKFPEVLIFHIPNGEFRSPSTASRLKKAGVVPGIPDLFCPAMRLWIEIKREDGGKVSNEQKRIHQYLESIGDTVIIAHGAREASERVLFLKNKS